MQAARELVVFVGELTARMQTAEDQLNGRNPLFRVNIHRHAAAIVDDFQRLIGVQDNVHAFGMTCQRFVHTVINYFWPGGLGASYRCTSPGGGEPAQAR